MWFLFALVQRSSPSWAEDRLADQAALGRMARGDHQALAELYDRHARPIFSLALRILQERAEAEDVVQEVFAQAWTQAARYDTARGAVAAWLLNMTRSRAIDRLRSKRARPEEAVETGIALDEMPGGGVAQDAQLLSAEQVGRLRNALQALPALQRIALELAYYEGLTHAEIADRLEQPLGTVKTRIRQAMIKLRESMVEI
jgi:RNA polymerase sigma-70 factor (ECF subfamily)